MPTEKEIEAGRNALLLEVENMPGGEIRRSLRYLATQVLSAAEIVRCEIATNALNEIIEIADSIGHAAEYKSTFEQISTIAKSAKISV